MFCTNNGPRFIIKGHTPRLLLALRKHTNDSRWIARNAENEIADLKVAKAFGTGGGFNGGVYGFLLTDPVPTSHRHSAMLVHSVENIGLLLPEGDAENVFDEVEGTAVVSGEAAWIG